MVEGAALGGRVIARALERRFGWTAARGCAFFAGEAPRGRTADRATDGEATAPRWREVLASLDRLAESGARAPDIVAAACATFAALARWIEAQGRAP